MTNDYSTEADPVGDALDAIYFKKADVVDNLTTNNSSKALSAKQGKELSERIGEIITFFNGTGSE